MTGDTEDHSGFVQTKLDGELKQALESFAHRQGTSVASALRAIVSDSLGKEEASKPGDRWRRVMVRLSTEEFQEIAKEAESAGLPAASWMRWAIKKHMGRPELEERIKNIEGRLSALEGRST